MPARSGRNEANGGKTMMVITLASDDNGKACWFIRIGDDDEEHARVMRRSRDNCVREDVSYYAHFVIASLDNAQAEIFEALHQRFGNALLAVCLWDFAVGFRQARKRLKAALAQPVDEDVQGFLDDIADHDPRGLASLRRCFHAAGQGYGRALPAPA
jgi:hypothetical protein